MAMIPAQIADFMKQYPGAQVTGGGGPTGAMLGPSAGSGYEHVRYGGGQYRPPLGRPDFGQARPRWNPPVYGGGKLPPMPPQYGSGQPSTWNNQVAQAAPPPRRLGAPSYSQSVAFQGGGTVSPGETLRQMLAGLTPAVAAGLLPSQRDITSSRVSGLGGYSPDFWRQVERAAPPQFGQAQSFQGSY